jgi:hypothetical protein
MNATSLFSVCWAARMREQTCSRGGGRIYLSYSRTRGLSTAACKHKTEMFAPLQVVRKVQLIPAAVALLASLVVVATLVDLQSMWGDVEREDASNKAIVDAVKGGKRVFPSKHQVKVATVECELDDQGNLSSFLETSICLKAFKSIPSFHESTSSQVASLQSSLVN